MSVGGAEEGIVGSVRRSIGSIAFTRDPSTDLRIVYGDGELILVFLLRELRMKDAVSEIGTTITTVVLDCCWLSIDNIGMIFTLNESDVTVCFGIFPMLGTVLDRVDIPRAPPPIDRGIDPGD